MKSRWTLTEATIGRLNCVCVAPPSDRKIERVAVFCHGFGAPGDDLVGLAEPIVRSVENQEAGTLLVFPAAPIDLSRYGMPGGRAWWPLNMARLMQLAAIDDFSEMRDEVPPGIDEARAMLVETIESILEQYRLAVPALTLGGFSQGAMLSVDTVARGLDAAPGKLVVLSGALICESLWRAGASRFDRLKVVQSHGRMDSILPIQTGRWLRDFLQSSGCDLEYYEFDGDHTIPYETIPKMAGQ